MKRSIKLILIFSFWIFTSPAWGVDWAVSLEFSVPNPTADEGRSKITLVAGIDPTAQDGLDSVWDVPVFFRGGTLQAHFLPPDGTDKTLWNDFRSSQFAGSKEWTIELQSNLNKVDLRWNIITGSGCRDYEATLTDAQGNDLFDPNQTSDPLYSPNTLTLTLTEGTGPGGPPDPPSDLMSPLQGKHEGLLVWTKGVDPDITYNVYRSTVQGQNYSKLNPAPISSQAYFDRNLSPGATYYYIVRGVNQQGCESNPSPEVALTFEDPVDE